MMLDGRAVWNAERRFDFAWDDARIPDPAVALAEIKAHALRVGVCESPYVSVRSTLFADLAARQLLLRTQEGGPYVLGWDTESDASPFSATLAPPPESGIVDFTHPGAYAWWRDAHEPLFAAGIDVIGCDGGEHVPDDAVAFNGDTGQRLHNVYPLLYHRCALEATAKFQPGGNAPPLLWGRSGWTGSQRVPVQSGGEPQSDWEGLAASIRGALSWGMSGVPCHGADVGGFYGSEPPSAELYVRWLQAAIFASHVRLNGTGEREPWAFGAEAEAVVKKWLAFRYRLIPYLQRAIADATATGMPVMRAMPLAFPASPLVRDCETQFLCGDALLVAPILQPGGQVTITLPPGAWYDLNSRQRFPGQRVLRYRATLDQFPVFGREGYALPLGRAVQHTGEIDAAAPLQQLWVFGKPMAPLDGFAQVTVTLDGAGAATIHAAAGVSVELFGDAAALPILPLAPGAAPPDRDAG
jgi:alpha-D-xyloside xylohydrolase